VDLQDALNNPPVTVPKQYQKHAEFDETGGKAATGPIRRMVTDYAELLELAGLDPAKFRIVGKVSQWTKTFHDKDDTYSFFFQFEAIPDDTDENSAAARLSALIMPVKPRARSRMTGLPMNVSLADGQLGKDGKDAPDHEAMDALFEDALAQVAGMVEEQKPSQLILSDLGDPIEGITSYAPNQIATNRLELDEQLRMWQRRLTQTILTLAPLAGKTHVVSVPSNHGEIRNSAGKIGYGDYGLGVARTVMDAFDMLHSGFELEFHFPETKYDVVTYLDVAGTTVAYTHGHHAKQYDRIPQWVANQAASTRSRMSEATIFVHGHYHQPGYRESRGRCIVSASMFDSGSPWFENLTGEFSVPAITTFQIRNKRVYNLQFVEPEI